MPLRQLVAFTQFWQFRLSLPRTRSMEAVINAWGTSHDFLTVPQFFQRKRSSSRQEGFDDRLATAPLLLRCSSYGFGTALQMPSKDVPVVPGRRFRLLAPQHVLLEPCIPRVLTRQVLPTTRERHKKFEKVTRTLFRCQHGTPSLYHALDSSEVSERPCNLILTGRSNYSPMRAA